MNEELFHLYTICAVVEMLSIGTQIKKLEKYPIKNIRDKKMGEKVHNAEGKGLKKLVSPPMRRERAL